MNIYDIAEKSGVSIATVSRVINKKSNVSPKTKEKVLKVIEELGYTPNIFARGLGLNTIKMVGVTCSSVNDIYYAKAVATLETKLREHGYDLILYCTGKEADTKQKAIDLLLEKKVDALMFVGSVFKHNTDNSDIIDAAKKVPVFLINSYIDHPNIYSVLCDDETAMLSAVNTLVQRGHSNILYLYESNSFSGRAKLQGFKKGLELNHLPSDPNSILKIDHDIENAYDIVKQQLTCSSRPTAILASDDLIAIGALQAVLACGFKVPEDIAIIGFNNSILSKCSIPALTTIDSKVEDLCSFAVDALINRLEGQNVAKKLVVSSELVIRKTL